MGTITGTVVKFTEKHIVLLMPDGTFKNIRRTAGRAPLLGERLVIEPSFASTVQIRWVAAAASLVVFALLALNIFKMDTNPAYIIALDINPSIEIQADETFRVISAEGLNKDGEEVLGKSGYSGRDVAETLNGIINQCIDDGYLRMDKKGYVKISVISVGSAEFKDAEGVREIVQKALAAGKVAADLDIETAGYGTIEGADKADLTINQYLLYQSLLEAGIRISAEEAGKLSPQELYYLGSNKDDNVKTSPDSEEDNEISKTGSASEVTTGGESGNGEGSGAATGAETSTQESSVTDNTTDGTNVNGGIQNGSGAGEDTGKGNPDAASTGADYTNNDGASSTDTNSSGTNIDSTGSGNANANTNGDSLGGGSTSAGASGDNADASGESAGTSSGSGEGGPGTSGGTGNGNIDSNGTVNDSSGSSRTEAPSTQSEAQTSTEQGKR
ncbi:MAG: hypothetical protein HGA22_01600 [Clostridiales bacterium]|nr:hypothetical protein [Clostridiales bacterium]